MNYLKKKNGITLIALVVTIIVLLILAGISISMLSGDNGILQKATTAKENSDSAQIKEKIRLAYNSALTKDIANQKGEVYKSTFEDELKTEFPGKTIDIGESSNKKEWIVTIDGVTENVPIGKDTPSGHNWAKSGDTLTCDHCNRTVTVGQQLNYTKTGTGSTSISAEKSGVAQGVADFTAKYNESGNSRDQLIKTNFENLGNSQNLSKDANTKWVVLDREDSNGDGIYETLLLTTETPTEGGIVLYGTVGYNNWKSEANRMAVELYGDEARPITLEDIKNCLLYSTEQEYYMVSESTATTATKNLLVGSDYNKKYWISYHKDLVRPNDSNQEPGGVMPINMVFTFGCGSAASGGTYDHGVGFRAVIPLTVDIPEAVN